MKRILSLFITLFSVLASFAQSDKSISIASWIDDEKVPIEAQRFLENKLQEIVLSKGYTYNNTVERFVLAAKIDVTQKDIAPTMPARISAKMDITLFVGDVMENKQFASCRMQVSGIGTNDTKTYISAFRKIDSKKGCIQSMLDEANKHIVDYYTNHCSEITMRAKGLVARQQYDEAIATLVSVPNICNECFSQCQQMATDIYKQGIDAETAILLNKAKVIWAAHPNKKGAEEAGNIIAQVNPQSGNYKEAVRLRNEISSKLRADDKRAWDYKMKQQANSHARQLKTIEAARAIGIAWANNRPKTIYKTMIYGW